MSHSHQGRHDHYGYKTKGSRKSPRPQLITILCAALFAYGLWEIVYSFTGNIVLKGGVDTLYPAVNALIERRMDNGKMGPNQFCYCCYTEAFGGCHLWVLQLDLCIGIYSCHHFFTCLAEDEEYRLMPRFV